MRRRDKPLEEIREKLKAVKEWTPKQRPARKTKSKPKENLADKLLGVKQPKGFDEPPEGYVQATSTVRGTPGGQEVLIFRPPSTLEKGYDDITDATFRKEAVESEFLQGIEAQSKKFIDFQRVKKEKAEKDKARFEVIRLKYIEPLTRFMVKGTNDPKDLKEIVRLVREAYAFKNDPRTKWEFDQISRHVPVEKVAKKAALLKFLLEG